MKLICAPMATLSHEAFRCILEYFGGCDEYYTEMINAGSLLTRGPFEKYYLLSGPVPQKIVWQLTGKKTEQLAAAAAVVAEQGGAGVDLNMGCSAPEIYRSGAGIAWMCKPVAETRAMVAAVRNSLDRVAGNNVSALRLSVKLRLGDENFTEKSFFDFCDMLVDEGVTRLTLHPRTRKEKYRSPPRWEYVRKLSEHFAGKNISVILNGNVTDSVSAAAALSVCPNVDGIMIGRAAVKKPWIFAEIREETGLKSDSGNTISAGPDGIRNNIFIVRNGNGEKQIDLLQIALSYIDFVQQYQPEEFWKTRLQRFFMYYCTNFSFAHYAQTQMLNAPDIESSVQRITDYFRKVPEDRYLTASFM
jgi:tRNA-dihydrouridine synthase